MSIPKDSYTHEALMDYARAEVASREFGGLTGTQVYEHAWRMLEARYHDAYPSPALPKPKAEPASPRVPCRQHREKRYVFKDGSVMEACTADECLFGKGTKRDSDGMASGTLYALDIPGAVEEMDEEGEVGPKEMFVEEWAGTEPVEMEDGLVPELPTLSEDADEQLEEELCET